MTITDIATLIPAEYQEEILRTNMIVNAVASTTNSSMLYLGTIWKNYINPNEDLTCGICLERILKNFKELLPSIIELTKKRNLLKSA